MAVTASGSVTLNLNVALANSLNGNTGSSKFTLEKSITDNITSGNGAGQADRGFGFKGRAIAAAVVEVLDVFDLGSFDIGSGAGEDPLGLPLQNAEVPYLFVMNLATSAGKLKVGGEGSGAAWSSMFDGDNDAKLVLPPGGYLLLAWPGADAIPVTDVTDHLLKFEAVDGAVNYDCILITRKVS